jgi:hypothetical protein
MSVNGNFSPTHGETRPCSSAVLLVDRFSACLLYGFPFKLRIGEMMILLSSTPTVTIDSFQFSYTR